MLKASPFDALRRLEFGRLDEAGEAYLDYTGSAIPAASLLRAHDRLLRLGPFGNPHSAHAASSRSTSLIEDARTAVLEFFGASHASHVVCFTANATAAIKLVAESYPFGPARGLVLSADNHNSVNGIREFARRAGAPVSYLPLDDQLRLDGGPNRLRSSRGRHGLFAFPAQSNFSGAIHPLTLIDDAHASGLDVLLDAASFVPTHALDIAACGADFVVISFYKMFGVPTGVGALIARRAAMAGLVRPWFAGGTVDFASVQHGRHLLRRGGEAFEDGTPHFMGIGGIAAGLEWLRGVGLDHVTARVSALTESLIYSLQALRHSNGAPVVRIYGPPSTEGRGGTIAFNLLDTVGLALPYETIERALSDRGVFVRGGCFCNPGAAEAAFQFPADATSRCLSTMDNCFSIPAFAHCLGPGVAVGAVRASVGLPTSHRDLARALAGLSAFRDCRRTPATTAAD